MNHLRAEETLADLADGAHLRPRRQRLLLARIEVEEPDMDGATVVVDARYQLSTGPEMHFGLGHHALDLHRFAGGCIRDPRRLGFVLVAQRQVHHHVLKPEDADPAREPPA
jgi:hypothetical protein